MKPEEEQKLLRAVLQTLQSIDATLRQQNDILRSIAQQLAVVAARR